MKAKHILLKSLAVVLVQLAFTAVGNAYFVMLPDVAPTPALPYLAEADHYGGPTCVQMILNTCPTTANRHYHAQADIYTSILGHNAEPATWFSDPSGIEGALEDPVFSPCGNWVDYSNTDKDYVLGKMLYWMKTSRYLTPVSITNSEHWVTVFGYETDVEPPYSGSVTLHNVFFYDPNPGYSSFGWAVGDAWKTEPAYWNVPLNKPGSAWHNKYIAIIEPPAPILRVIVIKRLLEGSILPVRKIEKYFYAWLKKIRRKKLARGSFKILRKDLGIEGPILIETPKYSYYLIRFKDRRLAAIFNAYDGSFEEFRYFLQPQKYIVNPDKISSMTRETVRSYKAKIVEMSSPKLRYDPELAQAGRFSPVWEVKATVKDKSGVLRELQLSVNLRGEVVSGLKEPGAKDKDTCCIHFEDPPLPLGTVYHVGNMFTDACVKVTVKAFQWYNGNWTNNGFAKIVKDGRAGGSGQEIAVNNINLGFDFGGPCKGLSLLFGEYGGNLNININGDFQNFQNFSEIDGKIIGGVKVSVVNGFGNDKGSIKLFGTVKSVKSFVIGGQELWLDHVCCHR